MNNPKETTTTCQVCKDYQGLYEHAATDVQRADILSSWSWHKTIQHGEKPPAKKAAK
jgi:hypothetical protein